MKIIYLILILFSIYKNDKLVKESYSEVKIIDSINTERHIIYICEFNQNKLIPLISDRDTSMSINYKSKIKIGEKYNINLLESDSTIYEYLFSFPLPFFKKMKNSYREFDRIKIKLNINYPVKYAVRGLYVLRNGDIYKISGDKGNISDSIISNKFLERKNDTIYNIEMSIKEDSINILRNKKLDSDLKYYYRFFFLDSYFYTTKDIIDEYYLEK